jgi:glucan phosphoethanolaminetransferase (alkaline phosphatase superfamily)
MNIYGYERETFPRLSRKLAEDDGFMTAMGESGGIATATSTLLFFNGVREPANAQELAKGTANLFKLAKERGFETYYYSNQESRLTMGLQSKYIDHLETNDANPVFFARYKDEGLVKMLEEIDFSKGKHFVVLHMRSPHSPYENRYKGREAEFEKFVPAETADNRFDYTVNTYDNALLYTDMVLDKMVTLYLEKTENTKSSLYMTADHGQLFNFQGHWGHNNLLLEQGRVPFFAKMNHRPDDFPETISHYEIGKLIARDIGAEIINPNETDRIMFLHGNNIDFPYDFITYKILSDGQLEKINIKNTLELSK